MFSQSLFGVCGLQLILVLSLSLSVSLSRSLPLLFWSGCVSSTPLSPTRLFKRQF